MDEESKNNETVVITDAETVKQQRLKAEIAKQKK